MITIQIYPNPLKADSNAKFMACVETNGRKYFYSGDDERKLVIHAFDVIKKLSPSEVAET